MTEQQLRDKLFKTARSASPEVAIESLMICAVHEALCLLGPVVTAKRLRDLADDIQSELVDEYVGPMQ